MKKGEMTKGHLKESYNNLQKFLIDNIEKSDFHTVETFKSLFEEYSDEYKSYKIFHNKTENEMVKVLGDLSSYKNKEDSSKIIKHMFLLYSMVLKNESLREENESWN